MESPSGTCKIKFRLKSMEGGSGRTLRRSSQLLANKNGVLENEFLKA